MHIPVNIHSEFEDIGTVAEYCPVCRTVRAFTCHVMVDRVALLHLIPLTEVGRNNYLQMVCHTCKLKTTVYAPKYTRSSPESLTLEVLIKETNPEVLLKHGNDLLVADKLRNNTATNEERHAVLMDALRFMGNGKIENKERSIDFRIDMMAYGAGAAILFEMFFGFACYGDIIALKDHSLEFLSVGLTVGIAASLYFLRVEQNRFRNPTYLDDSLNSIIKRMLGPLYPTDQELLTALKKLDEEYWQVKKKYSLDELKKILKGN